MKKKGGVKWAVVGCSRERKLMFGLNWNSVFGSLPYDENLVAW